MTHHEKKSSVPGQAARSRDPVCGMTVAADTPHKMEHGGTTYLFCSASCLEKFRKDPGRYAG